MQAGVLLFTHCLVNIPKVDKYTLAQLSSSTKYQCWNNVGSSTLNWCNFIDVVSTLFCQRWNNFEKSLSPQLSFSTKYQRWNKSHEHWFNVDVFAGMVLTEYLRICHEKQSNSISIPFTQTFCWIVGIPNKSGPPEVFSGKGVPKICIKFTGEHPCCSVISPTLLKSNFEMSVLL